MTDAELNNYRLTSLEEPSDEALDRIMADAVAKANERAAKAHKDLQARVNALIMENKCRKKL